MGPGGGGGGSRPFGEIFSKKINDNNASRSETTKYSSKTREKNNNNVSI